MVAVSSAVAATPSVPLTRMFQAAQSPLTDNDTPATSTRSPRPTMGKQHREGHERQLERQPPQQRAERDVGHERHDAEQAGFDTERPERLARRRHDDQHEQEHGEQLALGRQPVHDARASDVETRAETVPTAHGQGPAAAELGSSLGSGSTRARLITANNPKPTANVTATPIRPATPVETRALSTPSTP